MSGFEIFPHIRNCGRNHLRSENGLKSSRAARVGFGGAMLPGWAGGIQGEVLGEWQAAEAVFEIVDLRDVPLWCSRVTLDRVWDLERGGKPQHPF